MKLFTRLLAILLALSLMPLACTALAEEPVTITIWGSDRENMPFRNGLMTIEILKEKLGIKLHPTTDNEPLEEVQGQNFSQAESIIQKAKEEADMVFFLPHCGGQFNTKPGKLSQAIFEKLLNTKADAIIGGHPHTIQRCGSLNNKPYIFSLGNVSTSPSYPFLVKASLPEYGMIYHVYIEGKTISKTSFSLIKMTEEPDHYPVIYPVDELYDTLEGNEKNKIIKDVNTICQRVFNCDSEFNVLKEYDATQEKQ